MIAVRIVLTFENKAGRAEFIKYREEDPTWKYTMVKRGLTDLQLDQTYDIAKENFFALEVAVYILMVKAVKTTHVYDGERIRYCEYKKGKKLLDSDMKVQDWEIDGSEKFSEYDSLGYFDVGKHRYRGPHAELLAKFHQS
jgi:hypothetical protein